MRSRGKGNRNAHPEVVRHVDDDRTAEGHVRLFVPVLGKPVADARLFPFPFEEGLQLLPCCRAPERLGPFLNGADCRRVFGQRFARPNEAREGVVELRHGQPRQFALVLEHGRRRRNHGRHAHAPFFPWRSLHGRHRFRSSGVQVARSSLGSRRREAPSCRRSERSRRSRRSSGLRGRDSSAEAQQGRSSPPRRCSARDSEHQGERRGLTEVLWGRFTGFFGVGQSPTRPILPNPQNAG